MRNMMVLSVFTSSLAVLTGCGDVCDDAADKVEECDLPEIKGEEEGECNECIATCVTEASCDELTSIAQAGDYTDCIADCI